MSAVTTRWTTATHQAACQQAKADCTWYSNIQPHGTPCTSAQHDLHSEHTLYIIYMWYWPLAPTADVTELTIIIPDGDACLIKV